MNSVKQSLRLRRVSRRTRRSGSFLFVTEDATDAAVDMYVRRSRRRYRLALEDAAADGMPRVTSSKHPSRALRDREKLRRMLEAV